MSQWWFLSKLRLSIGSNTINLEASSGHQIRISWVPLDIDFETASREKKKLKRGWRAEVEITLLEHNSTYYADFLRMAANSESVYIMYSEPIDLGGKHLVIRDFEAVEVFHDDLFIVKVRGWVKEPFDNIPNL
jgi:hypothetical protein